MKIIYKRAYAFFAVLIVVPFLFVIPTLTAQTAGRLDAGFGTDSVVTTDILGADDEAFAVLLQDDGRICITGRTGEFFSTFAVIRYTPNGTLDPSFGEGGKSLTVVQGTFSFPAALARLPDGKLVVGGYAQTSADNTQIALVRLNTDGSLDTSFDADKITEDPLRIGIANALALQPDGRILAAGSIRNDNNGSDMLLARFESGLESPPPVPSPDFSLAPESETVTVARGKKVSVRIGINRVGFLLDFIEVIPPDTTAIKARVTPFQITTNGTTAAFGIKVKRSASAGSYPLVFKGRDATGRERAATVALVIN